MKPLSALALAATLLITGTAALAQSAPAPTSTPTAKQVQAAKNVSAFAQQALGKNTTNFPASDCRNPRPAQAGTPSDFDPSTGSKSNTLVSVPIDGSGSIPAATQRAQTADACNNLRR